MAVYQSSYTGAQHDAYVTKQDLVDLIYPVGSVYMSLNSTSPATLFGGSWSQITNKFLLGAGSLYNAGDSDGAASISYTPVGTIGNHTLTVEEIPSHAHGLNSHTHTVGAHTHGLNGHIHQVGAHAHGLNSHTHSTPAHSHPIGEYRSHDDCGWVPADSHANAIQIYSNTSDHNKTGSFTDRGPTHEYNSGLIRNGGSSTTGPASGNTANSSAFNTGASTGDTASSVAFNSGAATGTTAATGDGGGHTHNFVGTASSLNIMPPYFVVYMWRRMA